MTPATTRGATLLVAAVFVLLFAFTTVLNSAYHNTRDSRAEARYRDGSELASQGKWAQAEQEFRAALVYAHNDQRFRMALARTLMQLGRWSEAESYLAELREDDPTSGPINLMLARISARDGHEPDTTTFYQRAIYGYWPDRPVDNRTSARFELVGFLEREGQEKQVLAELLDLADETPETDFASRERVAAMLLAHGSPQHAADLFSSILSVHPADSAAERGLADALFALGDYSAARRAYRKAAAEGVHDSEIMQRIAASEAVLNLDPTLVRLSAGERFNRARELVRLNLAAAQNCGALPPDLASTAQKAAAESPGRRHDGDTLTMLSLAEQLWKTRQGVCSPTSVDPALSAVMAQLQKQ